MPRIKHVVETEYTPTFRTEKVAGMFDVSVSDKLRREWDIDLPIEDKAWQVGLIVGASGSGKTTLANKIFGDHVHRGFKWPNKCFLDDFKAELEVKDITETLSRVGFSSPPQWLLPYAALSNGQKFRVELARCLMEYDSLLVFDEFTSVVDRTVAQVGAHAFQKAVRKTNKQFVAVTCHYDVEEWLQPDWVFDVTTNSFKWGCLRRPKSNIEIFRVNHQAWELFKGHHYLNANANKSARFYVAMLNGEPIAITASLSFPHPHLKNAWRAHRTVVLPDYQGLGIGNRLGEAIGDIMLADGKRYISTTSHPSMVHHRLRSQLWRLTRKPSRISKQSATSKHKKSASNKRLTASFEYVGKHQ